MVSWCRAVCKARVGRHTFAIGVDGLSLAVPHLGLEGRCACGLRREGKSTAETENRRYIILRCWTGEGVFGRVGRRSAIARVGETIDGIDEIVEGRSRLAREGYLVEIGAVEGGKCFRVRS